MVTPEELATAFCDCCGQSWWPSHRCPLWALEREAAEIRQALKDMPWSPVDHGVDDMLDANLAEVERLIAQAKGE